MKRMKKTCFWNMTVILCAVYVIFQSVFPVSASPLTDTGEKASLTLTMNGYTGISFQIYKVAEVTEELAFVPTQEFAGYAVSLNRLTDEEWRKASETLAAYAIRDGLYPLASGVTDESGRVAFQNLSTGLYLGIGEEQVFDREREQIRVTPSPFLVSIPYLDEEENLCYDPQISVKYETSTDPQKQVSLKAVKIWKDHKGSVNRPAFITVQLLKDGAVIEEVELKDENGWQYMWEHLENDGNYRVAEKEVPAHYTVRTEKEGQTFILTNTEEERGTETEKESENRKPSGGGSDNGTGGKLPQTGQMWWPVTFFAEIGIVFLIVGCFLYRRDRENK